MMVDERESRNGHGCDLNCSVGTTTEGTDNIEGGLLLDGSSGGFSAGEGTSAERLRIIYKRRKRRKMSSSDEKTMTEFSDKIKAGDGSAFDHDHESPRLIIDASPNELIHCRKVVLQKMHQSRSRHENAAITYPESGCTPAVKESADNVERSDNQTCNAAKGLPVVTSSRLLNQSEGPTISKLCEQAFSDVLISDKFSELCGLLLKNFGVVNINQILDLDAINTKIKNGAYETSPKLYHNDIRQVWTKLQQVGNEIVTLANSLSDNSQAHYEQQFVRKPKSTAASKCHGCGGTARPENCLVCDSCEEIYHVSCTDLAGPEMQMPPKTWYCARCCVSNGSGSPHDNCIVCEKLKSTAATASVAARVPTTAGEADPERTGGTKACFICKTDVHPGDDFRTCGHSLCAHKFYHCKCLTSKQLGVCGPCWYCPSCLCRRCLTDKDDDRIVLCDGCDQAYHVYCTTPPLRSIPQGAWFCGKCARELERIRTMKMLYEKKVKEEEEQVVAGGGLEMLVTAAKTLSHQETMTMDSSHEGCKIK